MSSTYKLTIKVVHSKYETATWELKKVSDSQVSLSADNVDPVVKPFKGIQGDLFQALQPYYTSDLESLEFLVEELSKKKKPSVVATWDKASSQSDAKLHKAIKDAVIKLKSGEVKKQKKDKKEGGALAFFQPKRKQTKTTEEADMEEDVADNTLLMEADNDAGDGGEAATIQDSQGAIKKVKTKKVNPVIGAVAKQPKVAKVAKTAIAKPRTQQKPPKNGKQGTRTARASINPGAYNTTIGDANNGVTPGVPVDAMTAGIANGGVIAPPDIVQ